MDHEYTNCEAGKGRLASHVCSRSPRQAVPGSRAILPYGTTSNPSNPSADLLHLHRLRCTHTSGKSRCLPTIALYEIPLKIAGQSVCWHQNLVILFPNEVCRKLSAHDTRRQGSHAKLQRAYGWWSKRAMTDGAACTCVKKNTGSAYTTRIIYMCDKGNPACAYIEIK